MSTGYSLFPHVLWITVQILVFGCHNLGPVMANTQFTPYVSEFEYASHFHPSKNPDCGMGWSGNANEFADEMNRQNFESNRYKRSPEEGLPVGQEPSIEVRAILLRCPKIKEDTDDILINRNIYNITAGRSQEILDFHGFDRDEPTRHSEIHDCRRKLIITMKFNNIGRIRTQEEFVVIDHVLDPVTMHKARLLNPFVIKVRQEPVLQLYGLKFRGVVNAEATEEVINNKQPNYMGCDDSSSNPTCGQMYFEDKPIPFSQGFCCSCDPEVNNQKEAAAYNESFQTSVPSYFSRSRERLMSPNEKIQNGRKSVADGLSYPEELKELLASNKGEENLFDDSKNANNNERDLINLKSYKTMNRDVEEALNLKSNRFRNENRKETRDKPRSRASSWLTKSSRMAKKKTVNLADRRPGARTDHKAPISKSDRNDKDGLSKRRSPINLIDELTKLEEDYKNFLISSVMKDEEKKDPESHKKRLNNEGALTRLNEKFSDQRFPVKNVQNFYPIESPEKKLLAKNYADNRFSILSSTPEKHLDDKELIHGRNLTPIAKVCPASEAENELKLNNVTCNDPSSSTQSSEEPQTPVAITACSDPETPVILWQKLSSDRVYPSSRNVHYFAETRTYTIEDWPRPTTQMTLSPNEIFDHNVADLLADIVFSEESGQSSQKNSQSVDNPLNSGNRVKPMDPKRTFPSAIKNNVRIAPKLESTDRMGQRDENNFTRRFDVLSARAKNSTDSSSSFSSGNHTKNDAIVSSSSLKNQLVNWLTYERAKQYETRADGKSLSENNDEKIEFKDKDEIEGKRVNGALRHHDFRKDRSDTNASPVQVYLGMGFDRETSKSRENKLNLPKVQADEEHSAQSRSFDYLKPKDVRVPAEIKLEPSSIPRSYRSITEDNRFFESDNDQQKNIDKKIDDEFEGISNVLKDAGKPLKVNKENPKSDNTFEKDEIVSQKYASIFEQTPSRIRKENDSTIHQPSVTVQMGLSRSFNDNYSASQRNKDLAAVDRSKLRNVKEDLNVKCNSRDNICREKSNLRIEKFDQTFGNPVITTSDKATSQYKVVNEFNAVTTSSKIFTTSTTKSPVHRAIIASKSAIEPSLGIPVEKAPQMAAETGNNSFEIAGLPGRYKNETHDGSSILMVEDVKVELRKQAEPDNPQSPISSSKYIAFPLNPGNAEERWKIMDVPREVNTELTPAEKVEDLITDAETLPPDEEINSTTTELPNVTYFRSSITTDTFINESDSNSTAFPQSAIRNLDVRSPEKKTNKVLLLIEQAFPSSSASERRRVIIGAQKKSINHRHGQPNSHRNNNKRLAGKRTNDENTANRIFSNTSPTDSNIQKIRSNNNSQGIPILLEDEQGLSNAGRTTLKPRRVSVSNEDSSKHARKTVITLKNRADSNENSNLIPNANEDAKKLPESMESVTITGRSRRTLQNLSSRTFQSFYPRSSDLIAMSLDDTNHSPNKRADTKDAEENEGEALIFYDYEENEGKGMDKEDEGKASHVDLSVDDKRSLDTFAPGEIMIEGLEPSEGWKEKMEMLKLKKHADVLKEYLNWRQDVLPLELKEITGYTTKIMTEEDEPEATTCIHAKGKTQSFQDYTAARIEVLPTEIMETDRTLCSSPRPVDPVPHPPNPEHNDKLFIPIENYLEKLFPIVRHRPKSLPIRELDSTHPPVKKPNPKTHSPAPKIDSTTCSPIAETNPKTCAPIVETMPTTCSPIAETNPTTCSPVEETNPTTCSPVEETNPTTCSPVEETNPSTWSPVEETNTSTRSARIEPIPTTSMKEPQPISYSPIGDEKEKPNGMNTEKSSVPLSLTSESFLTPHEPEREVTGSRSSSQEDEVTEMMLEISDLEVTMSKSSYQQHRSTEAKNIATDLEPTFVTNDIADNFGNVDALTTLGTAEISTGRVHDENNLPTTHEHSCFEETESTGKILPPCVAKHGSHPLDSPFNPLESTPGSDMDVFFDLQTTISSENITPYGNIMSDRRDPTSKKDNGCVIISILKQSLLADKKLREMEEKQGSLVKMSKYDGRKKNAQNFHKRRRRAERIKSEDQTDERLKARSGRRLMFILAGVDESNDDYEEDPRFEDSEDDEYVDFSNDMDTNNFNTDSDNVKLNLKWDNVIGKILHENISTPVDYENTSRSWLQDSPNDNRSALKELHIYDTDKYIGNIAKKIVRISDKYDSTDDTGIGISGQKNSRVKRTLMQYSKNILSPRLIEIADSHENKHDAMTLNLSQKEEAVDDTSRPLDGRSMSIGFDSFPASRKSSQAVQSMANESTESGNDTKVHAGEGANLDVLTNSSSLLLHPPRSPGRGSSPNLPRNRDEKYSPSINDAPIIRKKRSTGPQYAKKFVEQRRDRSYDAEDNQDSEDMGDAETYLEDDYDYGSRQNYDSFDSSADSRVLESAAVSDDRNERDKLDDQEVKLFEIIPLELEQSPSALSGSEPGLKTSLDSKVSRMTASQLPQNPNDNVSSEVAETPSKIVPTELLSKENEHKPETTEKNIEPHSPEIHPVSSSEDTQSKEYNEEAKKLDLASNSNYDLVPLVNIHIHQQPMNKEGGVEEPLGPGGHERCTKPGTTPRVVIDNHTIGNKAIPGTTPRVVIDNHTIGDKAIPTLNIAHHENNSEENDIRSETVPATDTNHHNKGIEESTEPNVKFDKPDHPPITPNTLIDRSLETTQRIEESTKSEDDRNNSLVIIESDSDSNTESRKKIQNKNMLAILEFMDKISHLLCTNGELGHSKGEDNDAIVKLERIIVYPKNCSGHSFKTHEESETSTESEIVIDEGITHKEECNETDPSHDSKPSTEETTSAMNHSGHVEKNEKAQSKSTSSKNVENFFFNANNTLSTAEVPRSADKASRNHIFPMDRNKKRINNFLLKTIDTPAKFPSRKTKKMLAPESAELPNNIESIMSIEPVQKSELENELVPWNFDRNMDGHVRDMRNGNRGDREVKNVGKLRTQKRYESVDKIKANDKVPALRHKVNVHRSINTLSSDSKNHVVGGGGGSVAQSPLASAVSSRISTENSENFPLAKSILRDKRRRRKKKRRRKGKRRRKKKKKRKKGKSPWATENRGKSWWPFKRQLMSLSEKRHSISGSNFHQLHDQRFQPKKRAHRSFPLKQRKLRRLRAYRPSKKKTTDKNHRQYKHVENKKRNMKRLSQKTQKKSARKKRQINPGGTQTRGGQDCMDRRHPPNVNPVKYLESAHCLRFSDLWYSAYEMDNPIMEHTVYLQVFEKHSLPDGTTHWDDRTQGTMVRMGTFMRQQRDEQPTIVFTYSGARAETQNRALNLDPSRQRLLIPSPVAPSKATQFSAVRGPGEYLVVETNSLSKDGKDCDKAGVGFVAFAKQEDRCGRPKGACLKNQPLAYWRHDMKARDSGRPGCYLLSNFATVPTNPIKYNVSGTGSQEYLGLEYHSAHVSAIDIEVRTDYNAIVRVGSSGRVTEVYVDSTSLEHTVVTVVISNMGLASSPYQPRITDCPAGLPVSWTRAKGVMQVIPPQHDQRVTLDLYGQLLLSGFHCTVEVVNHRGELVAMRRIRVQKMDRCFCVWHCLCACIGSVSGIRCQPMSLEHYHAAGFQGPVPVITTETSFLLNTIKDILMLCTLLVLLLLLLGFLKWITGLFVPTVGRWGLECLLEGTKLERYLEPELRCRRVVTDENDVPVHPDTCQRTVRICSRKLEFFLNMLFFLTYPIVVCCNYCKNSWRSTHRHHRCPDESTVCLMNEKPSYTEQICVNTYGDCTNSKLEAEDTRYVINELKKSQESLQNPKGTKVGLRARKRDA